jgi:hypothetical protein
MNWTIPVAETQEMPRRDLIILQPTQRGDVLDLFAGLVAIGLLEVIYEGGTGLLRVLLALGFVFLVPGRAVVANWPWLSGWSEVGMSMVLSLAVLTLVATVTLWAHSWRPLDAFQAEAWLSLAGLGVAIVRRHRRRAEPAASGDVRR